MGRREGPEDKSLTKIGNEEDCRLTSGGEGRHLRYAKVIHRIDSYSIISGVDFVL